MNNVCLSRGPRMSKYNLQKRDGVEQKEPSNSRQVHSLLSSYEGHVDSFLILLSICTIFIGSIVPDGLRVLNIFIILTVPSERKVLPSLFRDTK